MSENRVGEFAEACGAASPVDLRIERADGVPLVEGELDLPCALIGRDPNCEVVLADPDVALRHACLQVVGGRVLVADLGSRTGVHGAVGGDGFSWLTPAGETKIGPFRLFLRQPVSTAPAPLDRLPNPLHPNPRVVERLPKTVLRFLNGRPDLGEWPVNRLLTMVGRSEACKVSLAAADVADRHCYFLLTPIGLWVVDLLSPTGTWVNGVAVRLARLGPTDEVRVGPFRLGVGYPNGEPKLPAESVPTGFRAPKVKMTAVARPKPPPARDPDSALEPITQFRENSPKPVDPPGSSTRLLDPRPPAEKPVIPAGPLAAMIEGISAQMLDQHKNAVAVVAGRIDHLPPDRLDAAKQVLARLADLNAELGKLQAELLGPDRPEDARPDTERMAVLQDERHGLWQKLLTAAAGLV